MAAIAALSAAVPWGVLLPNVGVTMRVSGRGLSLSASSALPNPESLRNSASAWSAVITRTAATSSRCRSCFATEAVRTALARLSM